MIYTHVKSYYQSGAFTGCEHLIPGDDHVKALDWFRREYPEHHDCIVIAQTYDSGDPKNCEHYAACLRCGCVH